MAWTDELKQQVIDAYLAESPTPETSVEIVKDLAEKFDQTANGVRMVLSQAKVYVVKGEAVKGGDTKPGTKKPTGEGAKRVSKEDSINALKEAIKAKGKDVEDEILDKLTGKAAIYLLSVIED